MSIEIYTDGATSKNGYAGAKGGWAFVIADGINPEPYHEYGAILGATNQQMELMAAIKALDYLEKIEFNFDTDINIYSDSAYLCNCFSQNWWGNWEKNGWRNAKKEPVANKELWQELIAQYKEAPTKIHFIKVPGHAGNRFNEMADKLAVRAREEL